jgi:prepilin-type N-terminal cleavage/methylation domain-containing protein
MKNHGKVSGFTLVEMMASLAISSMILLVSASVLGIATESYQKSGSHFMADAEARAIMQQLASDLSSAEYHPACQLKLSSTDKENTRFGFLCLKPIAAQLVNEDIGDLCAVVYSIKDLSINGKSVRCLTRTMQSSQVTFAALRQDQIGGLFTKDIMMDEPIGYNIISIVVKPMTRGADGQWIDWDKDLNKPPDTIEIQLNLADEQLAKQLKSPEEWNQFLVKSGDNPSHHANLKTYHGSFEFGHHEIKTSK